MSPTSSIWSTTCGAVRIVHISFSGNLVLTWNDAPVHTLPNTRGAVEVLIAYAKAELLDQEPA